MRRRARVDANHKAVTAALRDCGWHVHDTSRLGGGFPDMVIAKAGRLLMVEVKDGTKPPSAQALTEAEEDVRWHFYRKGVHVQVVTSIEQAVAL